MRQYILPLVVWLIVTLFSNSVFAQETTEDIEKEKFPAKILYHEKIAIRFNYFGELGLHPGLEVGTDYTLSKRKWITIHWDTGIGGYWHRWNNTSLFLKTTIGTRFPIWSMFVDFNLGGGYMHSFLAGPVYQMSKDGGVEKASNWGSSHFMPSFSTLIGWDGTRKRQLPITVHIGAEAYLQSNFNHIFLPHVAAKIGMTYKFK